MSYYSAAKPNANQHRKTRSKKDQRIRLNNNVPQHILSDYDIVRLPKIHSNLYLSSAAGSTLVKGDNVSKFCIAGKPVSDYMRQDFEELAYTEDADDLAKTQAYVVVGDTLNISQCKFNNIFNKAADYIEETIHERPTIVHCHAGINRSTTAILAWFIKYGESRHQFSDWFQARDYIREMNKRHRNLPALINPTFEQLLDGFNRKYGS